MKYYFTLIMGFVCFMTQAQTLQFSRVLLVDQNQQTVPPNKVWKLESITAGSPRTSFSPYSFVINNDTVYVGKHAMQFPGWTDIKRVDLYLRTNSCNTCSGSPTLHFFHEGWDGPNFYPTRYVTGSASLNGSNWVLFASASSPNNNSLTFTRLMAYTTDALYGIDLKITVTYSNGTTADNILPYYNVTSPSWCNACTAVSTNYGSVYIGDQLGAFSDLLNSNGTKPKMIELPMPEMFSFETKLPMWIPAGTTLRTNSNTKHISVIEFTVIP